MNNVLTLIPAKYRKIVYVAIGVAAPLYGVWEAANHDWKQFAALLIAGAGSRLAHANTKAPVTVYVSDIGGGYTALTATQLQAAITPANALDQFATLGVSTIVGY